MKTKRSICSSTIEGTKTKRSICSPAIEGTKTKQSICSSTIEGMKTKRSFCSSTIEGTKTKRSIRSSTIDDLLLLVLCLILRTEFRKLALLFVPWNGISSCFLFREMVWNRIPSVFFYFCSTARNSELFSLLWNGSERNSESFLFRGTARIPPEPSNCSVNSVFRGKMFLLEIANPRAGSKMIVSSEKV
jgi:hypothetical protein